MAGRFVLVNMAILLSEISFSSSFHLSSFCLRKSNYFLSYSLKLNGGKCINRAQLRMSNSKDSRVIVRAKHVEKSPFSANTGNKLNAGVLGVVTCTATGRESKLALGVHLAGVIESVGTSVNIDRTPSCFEHSISSIYRCIQGCGQELTFLGDCNGRCKSSNPETE
jgi:hypothetical protein